MRKADPTIVELLRLGKFVFAESPRASRGRNAENKNNKRTKAAFVIFQIRPALGPRLLRNCGGETICSNQTLSRPSTSC